MSALINGACVRARLGLKDRALDLLEKALSRHWGNRDWIEHDRDYDESWQAVDASGQMPDGSKFSGVNDFRSLLTRRPEQIAMTFAERMLTYALGRGVEYYDMPALRKIVRDAACADPSRRRPDGARAKTARPHRGSSRRPAAAPRGAET